MRDWIQKKRAECGMKVERIAFHDSREWLFSDQCLEHRSGRFFSVIGAEWDDPENDCKRDGMLLSQPESGYIGWSIYRDHILIQAKAEPGNINLVQIAPSLQATSENLDCVHGGKPPVGAFLKGCTFQTANLQSEQGTRYYDKLNLNFTVIDDSATGPDYRWVPTEELLLALDEPHLVNTDARSALVSAPWEKLVLGRPLFSRAPDQFKRAMMESISAFPTNLKNLTVFIDLTLAQAASKPTRIKPIWPVCILNAENELIAKNFRLGHYRIEADREVKVWDQPLVKGESNGLIRLEMAENLGMMVFLMRFRSEPGLRNRVEIGPTQVIEPDRGGEWDFFPYSEPVLAMEHSEEGGRFYHEKNQVEIVQVEYNSQADGYWMTLAQLQVCASRGNTLTAEARTALSLLLKWL